MSAEDRVPWPDLDRNANGSEWVAVQQLWQQQQQQHPPVQLSNLPNWHHEGLQEGESCESKTVGRLQRKLLMQHWFVAILLISVCALHA